MSGRVSYRSRSAWRLRRRLEEHWLALLWQARRARLTGDEPGGVVRALGQRLDALAIFGRRLVRWMIDHHLSLVSWPRETIVQDMHLDRDHATITPLRSSSTWVGSPH